MRALLLALAMTACAPEDEPCLNSDVYPRDCSFREPAYALDFGLTSPSPGQVLELDVINITGRITTGRADAIRADGIEGFVSDGYFTIRGVPLSEGNNVIRVEAANASEARTRLLLVSRGPMPVLRVTVVVDEQRQSSITDVAPVDPFAHGISPSYRGITYRLRDASGELLFRSEVPYTGLTIIHGSEGGALCSWQEVEPTVTDAYVPDVPSAETIELVDEGGCLLGRGTL